MASITKKKDLLDFINKEIDNTSCTDISKALKLFTKCLSKSIIECFNKFSDIENIDMLESIKSCSDLVFHVYWSLLSYTNNLRLTIFLSERAVLLFSEFIAMSRNPLLNKELKFTPNINDALVFAYKKTIGPLRINNNKINNNKNLNIARNVSIDIKFIYQEVITRIFSKNIDDFTNVSEKQKIKNIAILLENINACITNSILNCYNLTNIQSINIYIYNHLYDILNEKYSDDLLENIILIRIILDFFKFFYSKIKDIHKTNEIMTVLCDKIYNNRENVQLKSYSINSFHKNIKNKKIYTDFQNLINF